MVNHVVHVCSFEAVDLSTKRGRKSRLTYDEFKRRVLRAGRFSVFEATATARSAQWYDRLCRDPEVETDLSCGFPWTLVRPKETT